MGPMMQVRALISVAVFLLALSACGQPANSGWSRFRGNNLSNGVSPGSQTISALLWSSSTSGAVNSSPVVGPDGTVYVGSLDNSIYAFNGVSGAKKWSFATGSGIIGSAAVGGDGTVYIGSTDDNVYALDGRTGALKWQYQTTASIFSSPAIGSDNSVYVYSQDGYLYSLQGANGKLNWKQNCGQDQSYTSPTLGPDGTIYMGAYYVEALNPADGSFEWADDVGDISNTLVLGPGGSLYVETVGGAVYSLDSAKGGLNWGPVFMAGGTYSAPALSPDGHLYLCDSAKYIYQVNAVTGSGGYFFQTGHQIDSSPAIDANGNVYVGDDDGNLYEFNLTAITAWKFPTAASSSSPAIGPDGTLFIGSGSNLIALKSIHVSSITLSSGSVASGGNTSGTVTLSASAPTGGMVVSFASNPSLAQIAPVTIPAGSATGAFTVATDAVATTTTTAISAYPGLNVTANLTITAANVQSVTLNPTTVGGGGTSTGTVTLPGPAAPGGIVVSLASDNSAASVPATISIPAGQASVTFPITTTIVNASTVANISATLNGQSQVAPLTVTPPTVSALVLNPTSVAAGTSSTGTVTLNGVAGSAGVVVALSSSSTLAVVPAIMTVASGQTSGTFTVSTSGGSQPSTATITATTGKISQSAGLAIGALKMLSVTLNPTSVTGGTTAVGTVTLSGPAGPSGLSVTLASGSGSASVPTSCSIPAGQSTGTFNVTTFAVNASTVATVKAIFGPTSISVSLTINPPTLASVTLNPSTVPGGLSSTGTVSLSGPVGTSPVVVSLTSNNSAATVPSTVTIAPAQSSATFSIATIGVTAQTSAVISATFGGVSQNATLAITAASLVSLSLSPSSLTAGGTSTGTVTLSSPAGTGGATIALSSGNAAASVPSSVSIAAGQTTATFSVSTSGVNLQTAAVISATLQGLARTADLTIAPAALVSVVLNPTSVVGGNTAQGTVTVNGPTGSLGAVVALSSNSSVAAVPSTVTIPAGMSSATFTIYTNGVTATGTATISGNLAGVSQSATLTIGPASLASVTFNPASVIGGNAVVCTVSYTGSVGQGGITVSLSSSSADAKVPSTIFIASGQSSASFTINTSSVTAQVVATVTAKVGSLSKSGSLSINPVSLASISLNPTMVAGGMSSTGTLTLDGPAPKAGDVVHLTSNLSAVVVPGSVTIAAGKTSAGFTVTTSGVPSQKVATITAKLGTTTLTATLTVSPPVLSSISVSPTAVTGGSSTTGTVTLSGVAPTGGLPISLSGNSASETVPASVSVPAGKSTATFTIKTSAVGKQTVVAVAGSLNGVSKSAGLTINPPSVVSVSLSPASVAGGKASTGTVTISVAAPAGGLVINLTSSNAAAATPSSLTIAAGKTSGAFSISTSKVSSKTTATISASSGSSAKSATLTIT